MFVTNPTIYYEKIIYSPCFFVLVNRMLQQQINLIAFT